MQSCAHVRHVAQASRKRGRVNYIHGTVCCHPERRASTVRYIATQLTGVLPLVKSRLLLLPLRLTVTLSPGLSCQRARVATQASYFLCRRGRGP
jgi:hypothetical protein